MQKFIVGILFWALPAWVSAQSVSGIVTDINGEPLVGASLYWAATDEGVFTDAYGVFSLPLPEVLPAQLITTYVGYRTDTLLVEAAAEAVLINLEAGESLETVVVTKQELGTYISSVNPIKTEAITKKELTRSACCDLAGCFNTQGTVQPNTTNIVTDAKELRILGLSGVYNQVL
ncbi:MAG: carboxypeptidase-like regulatory domain-containing protein, partial [Bacteroidota bacterium]